MKNCLNNVKLQGYASYALNSLADHPWSNFKGYIVDAVDRQVLVAALDIHKDEIDENSKEVQKVYSITDS